MARRRQQPPEAHADRPVPPPWVVQLLPALQKYSEGRAPTGALILDGFTEWRRRVQLEWCRENGCHRVGKTCEQISPLNKNCGAAKSGPPTEEKR